MLAVIAVSTVALPGVASAAVTPAVTNQAQVADAGFLAYAPAPVGPVGALCIVDSGVTPNPDLQAGIVAEYAINGGSPDDVDPEGHGTTMAMIAGAQGVQGMVGAWPQLRIVSYRMTTAPPAGQRPSYTFDDYTYGMQQCLSVGQEYNIKAVMLALGDTETPQASDEQAFENTLGQLHSHGIAVLAAAGNTGPGQENDPADEPGVLPIGGDTAASGSLSNTAVGSPCNFSATPTYPNAGLYAPGCGLTQADPFTDKNNPNELGDGTSQATAFAAASLVALESYDPSLTWQTAQNLLLNNTSAGGDLDVAAAFDADGLGQVVTQGNANTPQPAPAAGPSPSPTSAPVTTPASSAPARSPVSAASPGMSGSTPSETPAVRVLRIVAGDGLLVIATSRPVPLHAVTHVIIRYQHHQATRELVPAPSGAVFSIRPLSVTAQVFVGRTTIGPKVTRTFPAVHHRSHQHHRKHHRSCVPGTLGCQ